eukprot:TRINITY_DN5032_c0_g3_i1.p2 TRINITY_DN5032_c0_g3~~TRINITY_DN5032_c0_g3_i1.p2  ORF type:complete len:356 (+),score=69.48 TRINITY_DN5032_c0_g3_i1:364-1431(+)
MLIIVCGVIGHYCYAQNNLLPSPLSAVGFTKFRFSEDCTSDSDDSSTSSKDSLSAKVASDVVSQIISKQLAAEDAKPPHRARHSISLSSPTACGDVDSVTILEGSFSGVYPKLIDEDSNPLDKLVVKMNSIETTRRQLSQTLAASCISKVEQTVTNNITATENLVDSFCNLQAARYEVAEEVIKHVFQEVRFTTSHPPTPRKEITKESDSNAALNSSKLDLLIKKMDSQLASRQETGRSAANIDATEQPSSKTGPAKGKKKTSLTIDIDDKKPARPRPRPLIASDAEIRAQEGLVRKFSTPIMFNTPLCVSDIKSVDTSQDLTTECSITSQFGKSTDLPRPGSRTNCHTIEGIQC